MIYLVIAVAVALVASFFLLLFKKIGIVGMVASPRQRFNFGVGALRFFVYRGGCL